MLYRLETETPYPYSLFVSSPALFVTAKSESPSSAGALFGVVAFLGFTVELDELAGEALYARDGLLVFLALLSDELVDLVVVDEVVEVVLFVLPEFVFVEFDVLVPLDSERAFLSVLLAFLRRRLLRLMFPRV